MLKSFVSDTSRRDLWNSAFIMVKRSSLPSLLEWGVRSARRRQASSSRMRREEKGGGESRGGERYLNHNLKISTRRLAKKKGEAEGTNHMRQWEFVCRMPGNEKDPSYHLGRMWFELNI